jgi:hypothetical protein
MLKLLLLGCDVVETPSVVNVCATVPASDTFPLERTNPASLYCDTPYPEPVYPA